MTTTTTTNERPLSPGEMRALVAVEDATSASWQTGLTIALVLIRVDGEYQNGFISSLRIDERSTPLPAGRVRVAVSPSTAPRIKAAIRSGHPVPEEVVIQTADEEGGAE